MAAQAKTFGEEIEMAPLAIPTGQLWFVTGNSNSPPGLAGFINSDGLNDTILQSFPVDTNLGQGEYITAISVDTAAGYYWVIDSNSFTAPSFAYTGTGPGDAKDRKSVV